jgi:NitT/TauT family transport system substrate-binding protein
MKKFRISNLVLALTVLLVLAACGAPATPAVEITPIRLQFGWVPTIEYSPYFVAEADGLFTAKNLSVEFLNGGFDASGTPINEIESVVSGNADFGMVSADRLLIARSQGVPIVAIGTLYQRNPIAFLSLKESNITRPQDFIGKKVFIDGSGGSTGIAYTAMMSELGVDRSQIEEIQPDDFSTEPLTSGRVDVITAFINNQPVQLSLQGYDYNVILASDYGIELYPNVIFTTEDMIANHPDIVASFLNATVQGIQASVDDPQRAAEITITHNDQLNLESETQSMLEALPLFKPAGSEVGMMTDSVWQLTSQIMIDQGLLPESMQVQDAYTLQFLNTVYASSR